MRVAWSGGHHVANLHLVVRDNVAVDEQFQERAPLLESTKVALASSALTWAQMIWREAATAARSRLCCTLASSWRRRACRRWANSARLRSKVASSTAHGHVGVQEPVLLPLGLAEGPPKGGAAGREVAGTHWPLRARCSATVSCAGRVSSAHRSVHTNGSNCAAGRKRDGQWGEFGVLAWPAQT